MARDCLSDSINNLEPRIVSFNPTILPPVNMSGLRPTTPKLSSRPRPAQSATSSKLNPLNTTHQTPKSPPLTTSHNANAPSYPFLNHSPAHYLAPKEGSLKLKPKATVTPEAKSRLMKTPLASVRRGMTSSDSSDSVGSWIPPTPAAAMSGFSDLYDGEEEIGQTEAVMVSVRYVGMSCKRSKLIS